MNRKQKITVSITGIVLVLLILIGLTYGYYLTTIKGNTNEKSVTVSLAKLELKYDDGNGLISKENMMPGDKIVKTFSVENTGNKEVENYTIYLEKIINEFEDKQDLHLTLKCSSTDGNCNGTNMEYPSNDSIIAVNNIKVGEIQNFELTVEFLETNDLQNDNMYKKFEGNVKILDIRSAKGEIIKNEESESILVDNAKIIKNFKVYGNSIQSNIPTDYQELETISATQINSTIRTAGFNTGHKWKEVSKIEVTMQFLNTPTSGSMIFKSITSSASDANSPYISSKTNNIDFTDITGSVTTNYSREELTNNGLKKLEINIDSNESDYYIYFGAWSDGAWSANWQLKSLKIYGINNNLLKDFVPCYRISDKTIGVYDKINGDFQSNNGTGTFTGGKNLPTPENPIEINSVGDLITDINDSNYGKYKIPIKVTGKNLINQDLLFSSKNITKENNSYIVKNYPLAIGPEEINYDEIIEHLKEIIKPNVTYILSREVENYTGNSSGLIQIRGGGKALVTTPYGNERKYIKFSLTQEEINSIDYIYIYGSSDGIKYSNIQLEMSDNLSDYEPYQGEITNIYLNEPLRKIENYTDYIDLINKKVVRNIKELKLNGTEEWTKYPSIDMHYQLVVGDNEYNSDSIIRTKTNYYKSLPGYNNGSEDYGAFSVDGYRIRIKDKNITALDSWKNKLKEYSDNSKPLIVDYVLKNKIEENIEFDNLNITNNTINITINTNTKSSKIDLEYIK